ncbi:MAG: hypothetical protein RR316_00460 [Clostridia bacterium]
MSMPVIIPSTTTTAQAINDLIESVALEETGLSHIINAEGEKIQAFLAIPGVTPSQLLAVNASVQATLNAISNLEMILQDKLNLFSGEITA